jgi:large subunit ribosomal protein L29
MKQEEIIELSIEDLKDRLSEEKMQLTKTKLHHAVSQIENPQLIKQSRKTIARLMTELRKREIEAANKQL